MWTSDKYKNRNWFNDQWVKFTGKPLEELTGQQWQEGVHPDDLEGYLGPYHAAFDRHEPFDAEYRLRDKEGIYHWMLVRCTPQFDEAGEFSGYLGTCTDITDRKEAEQQLSQRSKVNAALFRLADRLHRAETFEEVYSSAMDSILAALECDHTSILLFDRNDKMAFVASRGLSEAYIAAATGHSPWKRTDTECTPLCVADVLLSDITEPLRSVIVDEGIRALGFIPLAGDSELVGKFMVYFDQPHEFSDHELEVSLTIGRQLVLALQRITARQELEASEQSLRLALEAGRMGTWEWNTETGRVQWSSGLEMIHGYKPGEFPGTYEAYMSRVHVDDRESIKAAIQASLRDGTRYNVEHRIVLPNGSVRWVEGRGEVIRNTGGSPIGMKGVCVEITNRKKIEEDLQFLANASALLTSGINETDLLQRVAALAVPGFADWCSVDLVDADGKLQRLAVSHVDPSKVEMAFELQRRYPPHEGTASQRIMTTGKSLMISEISRTMIDSLITDPDLNRIALDLGLRSYIGVPVKIREKTLGVIGFVAAESGRTYNSEDQALAEDLADRVAVAMENHRLYHELLEVAERKDAFLATLAHELRNPLAPIRYALGILGQTESNPEVKQFARDAIDRHVSHMVRLVDDLLDVSRITQGKLVLQIETVDLKDIIDQAIETAVPLLKAKSQTLNIGHWYDRVLLRADAARLAQVFSNLMSNASKFTPENGNIWITVRPGEETVTLSIRDDGMGIAPEVLPTVFEMFSQADSKIEQAQTGLGIGLSLVKTLVELHHGTVLGRSDGLGKGSEFIVNLPILRGYAPPQTKAAPTILAKTTEKSHRILVVDDNPDSAEILSMIVKLLGHQTETAHDGIAAVEKARKFRPEAIFMDIGLPRLNGYEAATAIRSEEWGKEIKLIALTGWGQDLDREKSKQHGFDLHLVKPVESEKIAEVISNLWPQKS